MCLPLLYLLVINDTFLFRNNEVLHSTVWKIEKAWCHHNLQLNHQFREANREKALQLSSITCDCMKFIGMRVCMDAGSFELLKTL